MKWLLFVYKVPHKPSASRVYVWRKLKKIGVISPQDSLFILPKSYKNLEHLQWLAEEIKEMNGESYLFEGDSVGVYKDEVLIMKFNEQVDCLYQEILTDLRTIHSIDDLKVLYHKYKDIRQKDFFNSHLGVEVSKQLKQIEMELRREENEMGHLE